MVFLPGLEVVLSLITAEPTIQKSWEQLRLEVVLSLITAELQMYQSRLS